MLQKRTPVFSPFLHKQKSLSLRARERIGVFFWEFGRYLQDRYGTFNSDLLEAADHGYVGAVKVTLKKKEVNINTRDKYGNTPLILAVQENNIKVVKVLIGNGADVFLKNKNGVSALSLASSRKRAEIAALLVGFYLESVLADGAKPFYHLFRDCTAA
jgi:hypothetical protein